MLQHPERQGDRSIVEHDEVRFFGHLLRGELDPH
jgi:hypothetical protein